MSWTTASSFKNLKKKKSFWLCLKTSTGKSVQKYCSSPQNQFPKSQQAKKVFKIQTLKKKKYTVFILTLFTIQNSNVEQEQTHPLIIIFRYLSQFR